MTDYAKALGFEGESDPAQDILTWVADKLPWVRDALRRLAVSGELSEVDKAELVGMIRKAQGLPVTVEPPAAIPLTAHHLGARGASGFSDTRILGIHDIRHVGRMADDASLTFPKDGLAAIYGANGAGKSGYTRIFRRAGSGRGDDLKKQILPDVFAEGPTGDASAVIEVEQGGAHAPFSWNAADPTSRIPGLWVFDSDATHAYVDSGNAIELLPFNIDIILRLREFCDSVRANFDIEIREIGDRWQELEPDILEDTFAEEFLRGLTADTTAAEIEKIGWLPPDRQARFEALSSQVAVPQERLKTLTFILPVIEPAAAAVTQAESALADRALEEIKALDCEAASLRQAAADTDTHLLDGHALPVGSSVWQLMWEAARKYGEAIAHPGHPFPDTLRPEALCPLCQQELDSTARSRLLRLEEYVSTKIRKQADEATSGALARKADLAAKLKAAEDCLAKFDISKENVTLSGDLKYWQEAARTRLASLDQWLNGRSGIEPMPVAVAARLTEMVTTLKGDMETLIASANLEQAKTALDDLRELQAWIELGKYKERIAAHVRDLGRQKKLQQCVVVTSTAGITRLFNTLKDRYLNETLLKAYEKEFSALNLGRLKVKAFPKADRDTARFLVDLEGRKHKTSKLSEILSEGERRALSLAAFLAEQSVGGGAGCLVFDDPVSSLDHLWAEVIAKRLATEAKIRQIIVFTHDLVFYDKLCTAAESAGVQPSYQRLFRREAGTAGHVDPSPGNWRSQKVKDRLKELKPKVAEAKITADRSPDKYERDGKDVYGRMRDTWERLVEELLFHKVVQRFSRNVATSELRYLSADPDILARIDAGMTRTSTFSHDNPIALTDPFPQPDEMEADLKELEDVAGWLKKHHDEVDKR